MPEEKLKLERMVAERTKELEEQVRALSQALDEEQELRKLEQQFVAKALHTFSVPLAIIDSVAQHVARHLGAMSSEDIATNIQVVRSAVRHMTDLMGGKPSATKVNAGEPRLRQG